MTKVTKEMLFISPLPARFIDPEKELRIVLTRDETEEIMKRLKVITVILLFDPDGEPGKESHWFYTDDYCFGCEITRGDYPATSFTSVPTSTSVPHMSKERPELKDGIVRTLGQYEMVYRTKGKRIDSIDELLKVLNRETES